MRHPSCVRTSPLALLAAFAVVLTLPLPSLAAEATRILSSFDEGDPFDIDIEVGFRRSQKRSKITHEYHTGEKVADVLALRYSEVTNEMPMNIRIGLFRDLELNVGASFVFSNNKQWRLPVYTDIDKGEKFDPASSTILNNMLDQWGNILETPSPIINLDENNASYHAGLSNIDVGLRWAPFSEDRDQYLPTWVLGFRWTIPSASASKPSQVTTSSDPGDIGDGVHRFTFSTAFSKQFGVFDPYLTAWYSLPLGTSDRYNNCDYADNLAYGGNCSSGYWSEDEVAHEPQHVGGFSIGTEIVPWENKEKDQRISIDIRAEATYFGSGRTYNELSDALGKLLWTEGYAKLGGSIGINIQPVRYVYLRLDAGLYHEMAHYLTGESTGKDLDGACRDESIDGACIDIYTDSPEISPNFDYRYDVPGRRFRVSETNIFTFSFTGRIQF